MTPTPLRASSSSNSPRPPPGLESTLLLHPLLGLSCLRPLSWGTCSAHALWLCPCSVSRTQATGRERVWDICSPVPRQLPSLQEGRREAVLLARLAWDGALPLLNQLSDLGKEGTPASEGGHEALVKPLPVKL